MGAMDDAVENGVGQGGIANDFMPAIDRDLAGMLSLASVGSEIPMSELHDGIALDDDAES